MRPPNDLRLAPVGPQDEKGSANYETDTICKLCLTNEPETICHFIVCPSNHELLVGINTDVKLILNSFTIGTPDPANEIDYNTMSLIHAHLAGHNTGLAYDDTCYLHDSWRACPPTDMHYSTFLATLDDIAATETGNRCTFPRLPRDYVCKVLHLCVHLYASSFELSRELPIWFARHPLASALGSSGDPTTHSWKGFNSWMDITFWAFGQMVTVPTLSLARSKKSFPPVSPLASSSHAGRANTLIGRALLLLARVRLTKDNVVLLTCLSWLSTRNLLSWIQLTKLP